MKNNSSVFKNIFLLSFSVSIKFLAVFLGFYSTKWFINLSTSEYASLNLITAYTPIVISIVSFGIPELIQKYYTIKSNKYKLEDIWTSLSFLRLISYFIGILLILLSFKASKVDNLIYILGIFTAQYILIIDANYRSVCDAKNISWQFSLTDFLSKFLLVVFLYLGLYFKLTNLTFFIIISIISYSIGLILDAFLQRKITRLGKLSIGFLKENFKSIIFLSLSTILFSTYTTTDRLFIKYFNFNDLVLNSYSIAYRVFEIIIIIPSLTMPILVSRVQPYLHTDKTYILRKFGKFGNKLLWEVIVLNFVFGVCLTIGLFMSSRFILDILGALNTYPDSENILKILSFGLLLLPNAIFMSLITIFLGGEKFQFYTGIFLSVTTILGYLIFIPTYGAVGAAFTSIFTGFLDFFLLKIPFLLVIIKRHGKEQGFSSN